MRDGNVRSSAPRLSSRLVALILLTVVLAAHGGSLADGLFFDDYWHRTTLREAGWNWHDLVEAATFELPGRLANLWFQEQPLQWRYARPVAMLVMKLEYLISGGNPVVLHALGLLWLWLTTLLVGRLATWALGDERLGLFAAVMFILHPHHVFAVSWIAARNALVSGFLLVAAVLACVRASRTPPPAPAAFALTLVLWLAALLARETAVIFPALALLVDAAGGGWRRVRARSAFYLLLAGLTGAYLYWRLAVFPTVSPPQIYFTPPAGAGYFLWAGAKLLHMLFAAVFQTPLFVGPPGQGVWTWRAAAEYAFMLAVVGGGTAWYLWASRGLATRWLWPGWLVLGFLPVVPVFVMPHFAYLPAVGLAVMLAVLLRRAHGARRAALALALTAFPLLSTVIYRHAWRGIVRSEQLLYADILAHRLQAGEARKLILINFPIAGIYAAPALREAWGLPDLEAHFLTLAPHPLAMTRPSIVEVLNEYELRVSSDPPGYFSGLSGRMLLDGMCGGRPLAPGSIWRGELFDTTVEAADDRGATRLRFTFHEPLSSPQLLFYVSTPLRPAVRLPLGAASQSPSPDHAALFEQVRSAGTEQAAAARKRLAALAREAAAILADPMQRRLPSPGDGDPALPADLECWWKRVGVSQVLEEQARWEQQFAAPLKERDGYFRLVELVSRIVRSDLYLTGTQAE